MSNIFVGGSQRSGTTLLQKILCSGSDSNPFIKESFYLRSLLASTQLALDMFADRSDSYFDSPEDLKQFNGEMIQSLLERFKVRFAPAKYLILKEPHMTQYFPLLFETVPNSKFVVIIRDPRDIVVSMFDVGKRYEKNGTRHGIFRPDNLPAMVHSILQFYGPVLNYYQRHEAFRQVCRYIKYEVLVQKPEETVAILQTFTGLNLSAFKPEEAPGNSKLSKHEGSLWRTELSDKGVSTQSLGRYQQVLSAEQITVVEKIALPLMKTFGYRTDSISD